MDHPRKHWCFTLNNYGPHDEERFRDNWSYSYLIMGKEVGANGTRHLQGYVAFETKIRLAQCKALDGRIHWEGARGNPKQNREYCSKEGDFREYGTLPKTGGEVEQDKWKHIINLAKDGDNDTFMEEYPKHSEIHAQQFDIRAFPIKNFGAHGNPRNRGNIANKRRNITHSVEIDGLFNCSTWFIHDHRHIVIRWINFRGHRIICEPLCASAKGVSLAHGCASARGLG